MRTVFAALAVCAVPLLTSCFTGVESTPRITASEIKKHGVQPASPEARLLEGIGADSAVNWAKGRRLYVCDDRIFLALAPTANDTLKLAGQVIELDAVASVRAITGQPTVQLSFVTQGGDTLYYRPGIESDKFAGLGRFAVPFTVDLTNLDAVATRIVGNTYYILQSRRYTSGGRLLKGRRYQPVKITGVRPGSESLPIQVWFEDENGHTYYLPMTLGSDPTSTHNFETLFAFENPRRRHNQISDATWALIVDSKIAPGMTPAECRLALGIPDKVRKFATTMGMAEMWTYDDGGYLYFEDGVLSRYRK